MKPIISLITFSLLAALLTTSCSKSRAPLYQAPPEEFEAMTIEAGETKTIADPKVNILFVVDNSLSMEKHQETLIKNIDLFADKFFQNPRVDFKIGVVPVYDSVFLHDTKKLYGIRQKDGSIKKETRKMNPLGELISLKDKDGNSIPDVAPFITRDTPNAKDVLKRTVAIGTQWGPEAEELFSPVMEVISNTQLNSTKNAGFYDKDAYLVVIFLTDADDVTENVTAKDFYDFLVESKGGNKKKVLIASAIPLNRKSTLSCPLDGYGPIYKMPELISEAGALTADLCSKSFGAKLAEFGQNLVNRVALQRIQLNFIPDLDIVVSYGTTNMTEDERKVIPRGVNGGYYYNPLQYQLIIPPDINITRIPGGEIFVKAVPLQLRNYKYGRLKQIGAEDPKEDKKVP